MMLRSLCSQLVQGFSMFRHAKRYGSIYLGTDIMSLPTGSCHLIDALICENGSEIAAAVYHLTPTGTLTPEAYCGIANVDFVSEEELRRGK